MANTAEVKAVITADDKASSVLKNFGETANTVGGKIASIAKVAAEGLLVAGAAATAFGVLSVKAFSESQDLIAQTDAVLKSTGQTAHITAGQVTELATSLQKTTKYSDEQVRSAENLLLTFTNVKDAVFKQATPAILDLATAMHEDLQSATIQVGKALNDPVLGITALHRIGVTFSQTQKDQIAQFVQTNQLAKAQGVILNELNKEFGGSAVAAGNTFSGSLAKLKNSLNDIEEKLGEVIVKGLVPFAQRAAAFINSVDWSKVIGKTISSIQDLYQGIIRTYQAVVSYLTPGVTRFIFVLQELWHWLYNMLAPSVKALADTFATQLWPQIMRIWNTIEPGFTDALKVLSVVIGVIVVAALWIFVNVLNIALKVIGFMIQSITNLINWFGNFVGVVVNMVKAVGTWFGNLPKYIGDALSGVTDIIKAPFKAAFDWIEGQIDRIKNDFNNLKNAAGAVGRAPGNAVKGIGGLLDKIPGFAEGGTVPGPIGAPQLAVVHGGEEVIPVGSRGTAPNINITISAGAFTGSQMDARKYAMTIAKALRDIAVSKNTTVGNLIGVTS